MHFLRYRVRFPDGYEEPADIKTVDGVIFPDNRTADVVQVQGTHDVQTGTTACGFHHVGLLPGRHPAVSQFCSLCRMNTIDEQERFIITSFLFQLFVSFHERLLCFGTAFMWNANGFSVAEAIAVQPFCHARNGVTDTPPFISQHNNSVCGGQKVIRQIFSEFRRLSLTEMAVGTAIFGLQFFIIKPVIQMATNCCFVNSLRLRNHCR